MALPRDEAWLQDPSQNGALVNQKDDQRPPKGADNPSSVRVLLNQTGTVLSPQNSK